MDDEPKSFQFRRTFEDTIKNQKEFKRFVKRKIKGNFSVLNEEEDWFESLLARAFLSQGNWREVFYEDGIAKIPLGPVHTFALNLGHVRSNKVKLSRFNFEKIVDIKELWHILYDELPFIFPGALEESFKTSGEGTKDKKTRPFTFDGGPIE